MGQRIICDFCGKEIEAELKTCEGCGLASAKCHKICCPYCGYANTPPARLPLAVSNLIKNIKKKKAE